MDRSGYRSTAFAALHPVAGGDIERIAARPAGRRASTRLDLLQHCFDDRIDHDVVDVARVGFAVAHRARLQAGASLWLGAAPNTTPRTS
jgi:hypothetical protein